MQFEGICILDVNVEIRKIFGLFKFERLGDVGVW